MTDFELQLVKTDSGNTDFQGLIQSLDHFLAITDGEEHAFYSQFNKTTHIHHVIVAYWKGIAVGCGAIKAFDQESMEVKRMYTETAYRQKGIAAAVLNQLETWAKEMGYSFCVLETGKRQLEAVSFYPKQGYGTIENYGPYVGAENSICFRKRL